jgi:hypothetical protein
LHSITENHCILAYPPLAMPVRRSAITRPFVLDCPSLLICLSADVFAQKANLIMDDTDL